MEIGSPRRDLAIRGIAAGAVGSKEHPRNARVAKVAEGAEVCVVHVRGRKTLGERGKPNVRSEDSEGQGLLLLGEF